MELCSVPRSASEWLEMGLQHLQVAEGRTASEWLEWGLPRSSVPCPPSYYLGPHPVPGTEMLVISVEVTAPVAGRQAIKLHLQWQRTVVFTVDIKGAKGTWPLSSILEVLCGFTVTIDIDPSSSTAVVVAKNETVAGVLMETKLWGDLEKPVHWGPSGRPSYWPGPPTSP